MVVSCGTYKKRPDGFEVVVFPRYYLDRAYNSLRKDWLRSWVQILPPGPFLSI
jgi:hypothetical protein